LPLFVDPEITEPEPPRPDVEILLPEPEK